MLLADVLGWPLSILILLINLPFIALGYGRLAGRLPSKARLPSRGYRRAGLRQISDVTPDKLLTAVLVASHRRRDWTCDSWWCRTRWHRDRRIACQQK